MSTSGITTIGRLDRLQTLCGLAVIPAAFLSWVMLFPLMNLYSILRGQAGYRPAVFTVTDATYANDDSGISFWLVGMIDGNRRRYSPNWPTGRPGSREDILREFPIGTQINVLFNPNLDDLGWNAGSLGIVPNEAGFWDEVVRRRNRVSVVVFVPLSLALAAYGFLRYWNRRQKRSVSASAT